jgi:methyl-accepting chemotaxis protein
MKKIMGDMEYDYPATYNLISITNPTSHITYASRHFSEVAGYEDGELIGKPHNVVRHRDMPKAAFKDLWQHLQSGKHWMGMVKNQRKGGGYYWVDAFASPIKLNGETVEYQSVRFKPERRHVNKAEAIYAKLNAGKKPWQLWLPRTRLWMRAGIATLLSLFTASMMVHQGFSPYASLATLSILSTLAIYLLTRPLERIAQEAREDFNNPLMELIYCNRVNDISEIEIGMKMRKQYAKALLGRVGISVMDSCQETSHGADVAAENGNKVTQNLSDQRVEIDLVATSVNEMQAASSEISQNAQATADATVRAQETMTDSKVVISEVNDSVLALVDELQQISSTVSELKVQTDQIGSIVGIINDIADQTNLLALNAAIEAARAGDQGRGFAVVADEVRTLAQRTQQSTTEIQQAIESIQSGSQSAVVALQKGDESSVSTVKLLSKADESIQLLEGLVQDVVDRNQQIAVAIEEQVQVSDEINDNIQGINLKHTSSCELMAQTNEMNMQVQNSTSDLKELVKKIAS